MKKVFKTIRNIPDLEPYMAKGPESDNLRLALATLINVFAAIGQKWLEHYVNIGYDGEVCISPTIPGFMKAEMGITLDDVIYGVALLHALNRKQTDALYCIYVKRLTTNSYHSDPEHSQIKEIYNKISETGYVDEDGYLVVLLVNPKKKDK